MNSLGVTTAGALAISLATALPKRSVHGVLVNMTHAPAHTASPLHHLQILPPPQRWCPPPDLHLTPRSGSALGVTSQELTSGMGVLSGLVLPNLRVL